MRHRLNLLRCKLSTTRQWFAVGSVLGSFMWPGSPSWGGTIYATGFEPPVFIAGTPIAGQDGWISRFGAGTISTNDPASGRQAVEIRGDQLPPCCFESVRKVLNFDVAAAGVRGASVAADVRLNGPTLKDDLVEAIFAAIDPSLRAYGQMQISADGHLYIYGNQFSDVYVGAVTLGVYHHLAIQVDFLSRDTTFSLDGASLATFAFGPGEASTVLAASPFLLAAPLDPPPGGSPLVDRSLYAAYFDNLSVETIPEPGSALLLTFAITVVAAQRRDRRAALREGPTHIET